MKKKSVGYALNSSTIENGRKKWFIQNWTKMVYQNTRTKANIERPLFSLKH